MAVILACVVLASACSPAGEPFALEDLSDSDLVMEGWSVRALYPSSDGLLLAIGGFDFDDGAVAAVWSSLNGEVEDLAGRSDSRSSIGWLEPRTLVVAEHADNETWLRTWSPTDGLSSPFVVSQPEVLTFGIAVDSRTSRLVVQAGTELTVFEYRPNEMPRFLADSDLSKQLTTAFAGATGITLAGQPDRVVGLDDETMLIIGEDSLYRVSEANGATTVIDQSSWPVGTLDMVVGVGQEPGNAGSLIGVASAIDDEGSHVFLFRLTGAALTARALPGLRAAAIDPVSGAAVIAVAGALRSDAGGSSLIRGCSGHLVCS